MSSDINEKKYDFLITDINYVVERIPNPNWHIHNLCNSNHHILAYAISGKSHYHSNNFSFETNTGDVLFFPKNFVHSASSNPENPWAFYIITFNANFMDENSMHNFYEMKNHIIPSNPYEFSTLFTRLNLTWTGKKTGYLIECRSILMKIMHLIICENNYKKVSIPHSKKIEDILNIMLKNYTQFYNIQDLAEIANLSPSHFRTLFKKMTGFSVIQYQNQIKINKAIDFLLSGECNVTESAARVGFKDIYYFSRLFKKLTGKKPSEYIM